MTDTPTTYQIWDEVLADPRFSHSSKAIRDYLSLVSGLESPTPYHVWSFISLVGALIGDNIAIQHGPMERERMNLGIILSGVPAMRKSSALSVMQRFAEGLPISYGPTDTAGQRQGIMSAMMPRWQKDAGDSGAELNLASLEALAAINTDSIDTKLPSLLNRKSSEVYFVAKELGRLISSQSRELFDFFADGMDGESFHYQLKNQSIKIKNPLINLLGAITPSSLGHLLPRGGESHGLLSRFIFVHASHLTRVAPTPEGWNERQQATRQKLHDLILSQIHVKDELMTLSKNAEKTFENLYRYIPATSDARLLAYVGRRAKQALKIAGILAVLRGTQPFQIIASDLRLAHAMLVLTESNMDRAFIGLDTSPYGKALCTITEIAETSETGLFSIDSIQVHAGYLGNAEMIGKMVHSLESQRKILPVKHDSSQQLRGEHKTPRWQLNDDSVTLSNARLMKHFEFEGETLGADEHVDMLQQGLKIVKAETG